MPRIHRGKEKLKITKNGFASKEEGILRKTTCYKEQGREHDMREIPGAGGT